jgi:3-methyladenine DNA glycosylase Tag
MRSYKIIYKKAVVLHPGEDIEQRLPQAAVNRGLLARDDAWYLSAMSRRIFRAGLKHSMVDAKWPAFEQLFYGFDPARVRMMSDEELDRLMQDRRIIRHWRKIKSVRSNAATMFEQGQQAESFAEYLASWPISGIVDLWHDLKKRYSQMGGNSAPYFLRMVGKDTFILTNDVVRALNHWGAYQGIPTSIKAKREVQGSFNFWAEESGRPLCQLSRILALSVDE